MATLTDAFNELEPLKAGATRNGITLDEIYSNVNKCIVEKEILKPLCKENGTVSDHLVIAAAAKLPRLKRAKRTTFSFRPLTTRGTDEFKALLLQTDWAIIEKETSSESATSLTELLDKYVAKCFPLKTKRISSNDAPWFNSKTRRLVNRKMRIYKAEGKSAKYKQASKECQLAIKQAKKDFIDKVIEKCNIAKNSKGYYAAVKMLNSKEAPVLWQISSLYPHLSDDEIAEIVAEFFNEISHEYPALPDPGIPWNRDMPEIIPIHEVATKIKFFKKPKSTVYGDINPTLVSQFSDILAIPLHFIFNQTLNTLSWPDIWKSETVHTIPKNSAPSGLSELRNLSCTPLYSKILESFVLDRLKRETKLSDRQYGGIKGSGTDHFLLDTWDEILNTIDAPETAANLISVDFSKAFNRMHHFHCLEALVDLGAELQTVDWVASFLHNRKMAVKINSSYSVPRTVPGGSPQGSILGNFLFCATTNGFTDITGEPSLVTDSESTTEEERTTAVQTRDNTGLDTYSRHTETSPDTSEDSDEDFNFFRLKKRYEFDSSESEPEVDHDLISREYQSRCNKEIKTYVYIDDFNSIEAVKLRNMPSHITTRKCKLFVRALKSEKLFMRVNRLAAEIGMRVNGQKTQMLCIHPCIHNDVETHIMTENSRISSAKSLRILGFNFDSMPNATHHVRLTIEKFYSRLWTLRFLKKGGLPEHKLLELYNSMVRSAVEYSSVIYHSMIPQTLIDKLERIQRQALRIIYGWGIDIPTLMEAKGINTLEERREKAILSFALKNEHKEKFGKGWFKPAPQANMQVRGTTRDKYKIPFCRTDRLANNPIIYMTRVLNEYYKE